MRLVVPVTGQHRHEVERGENARSDWRIDTTGKHYVLAPKGDVLRCVSDRVG